MPSNNPIFPQTPRVSSVGITIANFAKAGVTSFGVSTLPSPTFATAFIAASYGSRIDQIKVRSLGLNSAGVLRLFVNDGTTNYLTHETTLAAVGVTGSAITLAGQSTSGNLFFASANHGMSPGSILYVSAPGTLTALTAATAYYVTSTPGASTFTLSTLAGAAVSVPTNVSAATGSGTTYASLENASTTDYDITITKGSDTVPPIQYLAGNYRITATVGNIGGTPANMGWQVTVHGADY